MRQHEQQLRTRKTNVIVVTFQAGWVVEAYVEQTGLTWPILADPNLELYRAYGMERAKWQDLWGFSTWWVYMKLMARGRRPRRSDADMAQLGGDVLVDPEGIVRLHHVGKGPADRPTVESIIEMIPFQEPRG